MFKLYSHLPLSPGVYVMKNSKGEVIYVGKAGNLKRRVASYFSPTKHLGVLTGQGRSHDSKTEALVKEIKKIDFKKSDTVMEALILEANLIKKLKPQFNIKDKDDRSFLYVLITKEKFPRVLLVRGASLRAERSNLNHPNGEFFGPFTSAGSIKEGLKIIRKIFPFNIHEAGKIGKFEKPCFDYEIGLCPGTCIGKISRADYLKNIKNIKLIFQGKRKKVLSDLAREMKKMAHALEFERAVELRRQVFALRHIQDAALLKEETDGKDKAGNYGRIEGYDISNISGEYAVGSMVVFENGLPNRNEYRKFKIRTIVGANDVGMMKEVLHRRLTNNWILPSLMLVDGGIGQVNAVESVLSEFGLQIPVVGIAKGAERKNNRFVGVPVPVDLQKVLLKVRDEAHRFAIGYHKRLRGF